VATYLFAYAAPVISRLGKRDARGSRGTAVGIDGIALISTFITESIASRVADALHGLRLTGKEMKRKTGAHVTPPPASKMEKRRKSRLAGRMPVRIAKRIDQREHCSTHK